MDSVKAVKRHNAQYDLFNRLHSIAADQAFVRKVAQEWFEDRYEVVHAGRGTAPRLYVNTTTTASADEQQSTYAYFKSTDGHTSVGPPGGRNGKADWQNWNFNLRRANLPLASYAEEHNGLILVDSTRRGKRMPDALSKTIPIWCAVINRAVAKATQVECEGWAELYLPAGVVSPSECEQIIAFLPSWTASLLSSGITLPTLQRPLRPFFVHPSTSRPPHIPIDADYTPIICMSVSRWVGITGQQDEVPTVTRVGERNVAFEYVPGAGDDDELWAKGLKPAMFWSNRTKLLALDRDELDHGVSEVVATASIETSMSKVRIDDNEPDAPARLTGAPSGSSRLAVDLGPPVIPTEPWAPERSRPTITIWVVEVVKAHNYSDTIYTLPRNGSSAQIAVALPSAKGDSWAYKAALVKLVAQLRPRMVDEISVILRPGTSAHLDLFARPAKEGEEDSTANSLAALATPTDLVGSRKTILPIALLHLCSFPHLCPGTIPAEGALSKSSISNVLLSLVALWPDGNPPRAALKRVNEILLSFGSA